MRSRWLSLMLAFLCVAASPSVADKKEKGRLDPSGLALWSGKSGPMTSRQYLPGLTAVLLLSDAQVESLHAAWRETMGSPELAEKGRQLKGNPNAGEEQRQEVRLLQEAAHGRFQSRAAAILSPAQKELIAGIEAVYVQVKESVNSGLLTEFGAVKANTAKGEQVRNLAKERLAAELRRRLGEFLTAEQRAAFESAAAEEQRRDTEAAASKK